MRDTMADLPPAREAATINTLLVNADPDRIALLADFLDRETETITPLTETAVEDALARFATDRIDCIVSAYDMPDQDGLAFLDAVRNESPDLPFILFTGNGSEALASDAISRGVTDYLQTGSDSHQYTVLANRIERVVESHRTERALDAERSRRSAFLTHSSDIVAVLGPDGTYRYASPSVERILGYAPAELIDRNAFDYVHPADRHAVWNTFTTAVEHPSETHTAVFRFRHEDGSWRWVEAVGNNQLENAAIDGVIVNVRDVSDRIADARALERYETLVETLTVGVFRTTSEGQFVDVNPALVSLLDAEEPATLMDRRIADVLAPASCAAIRSQLDAEGTIHSEEHELTTCTGETIWGSITAVEIEHADTSYVHGIVEDISTRKERIQQLEQYETLLETVSDGVFLLDSSSTMHHVNEVWASMVGMDPDVLDGRPFTDLVEAGIIDEAIVEQYVELIRELLSSRSDREHGLLRIHATPPGHSEERIYECSIALLPYDEEFQGSAVVVRDVTEPERQREQLALQNRRLEEFAGTVSHDLQNPLNVAQGHLELARTDHDSEELETVGRALARMEVLIEDVLELARQGHVVSDPAPVDLAHVVAAARATTDLGRADLVVADTMPTVAANATRLRTLFENLFRNAVTHAGPSVTITVGVLADGDGFYVADDGPGIPEHERDQVFERGYSTNTADGSGLGLAIVRGIVEAHGWTVTITESDAGGTQVNITGLGAR